MPEAKKPERYRSLVGLYSSLRNYPKAIDFGNRALKISRDPETHGCRGAGLLPVRQQQGSRAGHERAARQLEAKGQVPKENQLLLVQAACSKAGDNACVAKVFEKLVSNYPKPDYWSQLLTSLRKLDTDDIQKLNVMRLSTQVNVMKIPEEYKEMAQLALEDKLAGEAQAVLEQGFSRKIFVDERMISVNTRLLAAAKKEADADKAALAKREAEARAAATGDAAVKIGAQYLGYGDAVKAATCCRRALPRAASPRATRRKSSASMKPASCSESPTCVTTTRLKPPRRSGA